MPLRKLSGDKIFDGKVFQSSLVLLIEKDGTIKDLIPVATAGDDLEYHQGILCPGFINCHCHLELSWLKGKIEAGTGLVPFLQKIIGQRGGGRDGLEEFIKSADQELWNNGVEGVADICNTADTVSAKMDSKIRWYNLIEIINLNDDHVLDVLKKNKATGAEFAQNNLRYVFTPHAPYSVSKKTFGELNRLTEGKIISIHNQESAAENEWFEKGTGKFLEFYHYLNRTIPSQVSGKTSLQSWLPYFTSGQTIIMVHNTFITLEDILFANTHAKKYDLKIIYCLCPNANLYIEERLPPVGLLIENDCTIVLGTDSYGSNHQLSILNEIHTLKNHFPQFSLETLLKWATVNGAAAMGWNDLGMFKKGIRPGILNISDTGSALSLSRIV